jgi:hypothetical protein
VTAPSVVRIRRMAAPHSPHNQKYSILRFGKSVLDLGSTSFALSTKIFPLRK